MRPLERFVLMSGLGVLQLRHLGSFCEAAEEVNQGK
jgi:hypothetical protein